MTQEHPVWKKPQSLHHNNVSIEGDRPTRQTKIVAAQLAKQMQIQTWGALEEEPMIGKLSTTN